MASLTTFEEARQAAERNMTRQWSKIRTGEEVRLLVTEFRLQGHHLEHVLGGIKVRFQCGDPIFRELTLQADMVNGISMLVRCLMEDDMKMPLDPPEGSVVAHYVNCRIAASDGVEPQIGQNSTLKIAPLNPLAVSLVLPDSWDLLVTSKSWRGKAMDYVIYTYDPGDECLKFRTMTIANVPDLASAIAEATRQIGRLHDKGLKREVAAWEVLVSEADIPKTFDDTERRVREIMRSHGVVVSTNFGVLDYPLMRKLASQAPTAATKPPPRMPYEAHMPAEKKASPADCMAAVRLQCGDPRHDPAKKFEGGNS